MVIVSSSTNTPGFVSLKKGGRKRTRHLRYVYEGSAVALTVDSMTKSKSRKLKKADRKLKLADRSDWFCPSSLEEEIKSSLFACPLEKKDVCVPDLGVPLDFPSSPAVEMAQASVHSVTPQPAAAATLWKSLLMGNMEGATTLDYQPPMETGKKGNPFFCKDGIRPSD
ncbi:uncharacterized protein LOC131156460 [Malania oleifera]|uniref:uncharacterized protein LOC131156460 n=1 Tax=Malania oleifera TaxID=397392 RepID=UPI0025AE97E0|nr:uncharacterized protein LOC131156460 [Malania oleifera]